MNHLQVELSKEEAQVILQMITQFNWAGQNLENTEKNVAVGVVLREKFHKALNNGGK